EVIGYPCIAFVASHISRVRHRDSPVALKDATIGHQFADRDRSLSNRLPAYRAIRIPDAVNPGSTMSRAAKWIGWAVVALVLLIPAVVALVDANHFRGTLSRIVTEKTGRALA